MVPVMMTWVPPPVGPLAGSTESTKGVAMIVNVAVDIAPLLAPTASTVYAPIGSSGTVKVALQCPRRLAVHELITEPPPEERVKSMISAGAYPLMVAVTEAPARPAACRRVIVGVTTVGPRWRIAHSKSPSL